MMIDFTDVNIWLAVVLFISVFLIVTSSFTIFSERQDVDRRLEGKTLDSVDIVSNSPVLSVTNDDGFLGRFDQFITPKDGESLLAIRKRLIRAGLRNQSSVRWYYVCKATFGLGLAVLTALLISIFGASLPLPLMIFIVMALSVTGFLLPSFWIERRIQHRQEAVQLGFPDMLDMVLVCIEAGNGLDQGLRRVASEIEDSHPVISDELMIITEELKAGKERPQVLRDFADRVGVDDVASFVTILNQSDEFGVSIADSLRVYASEMRYKRIMRAEELANAMPIKLALGTIAFTVPPVALMLAGPSVIMITRSFATFAQ
jgi:tight adherence protein C